MPFAAVLVGWWNIDGIGIETAVESGRLALENKDAVSIAEGSLKGEDAVTSEAEAMVRMSSILDAEGGKTLAETVGTVRAA